MAHNNFWEDESFWIDEEFLDMSDDEILEADDWYEEYKIPLEKAKWVDEDLLSDENNYRKLGELFSGMGETYFEKGKEYTSKEKNAILKKNATEIANKVKEKFYQP